MDDELASHGPLRVMGLRIIATAAEPSGHKQDEMEESKEHGKINEDSRSAWLLGYR